MYMQFISILRARLSKVPGIRILTTYVLTLFICYTAALGLSFTIWSERAAVIHTALELACVFIAFSTFLIVWHTHGINQITNHALGFWQWQYSIFSIFTFILLWVYIHKGTWIYPRVIGL